MWMITRYGFYSVVQSQIDKSKMMLRARDVNHLRNLQKVYSPIEGLTILSASDTDYPYRIILTQDQWLKVAEFLAHDCTEYSNFKDAAEAQMQDRVYDDFLHLVWAMARRMLQLPYQSK